MLVDGNWWMVCVTAMLLVRVPEIAAMTTMNSVFQDERKQFIPEG